MPRTRDDRGPPREVPIVPPTSVVAARPARALTAVEAPAALPFDVFESKLAVPPPRHGEVSRTGLVNRLRAERSCRLATVVAAAGYGKTQLLAQWAARDERSFAWLSVDRHDNDPVLLLRHLAAALDRVRPLDQAVLDALVGDPSVWSAAAPRVAAALSSAAPLVVVLDDADLLEPGESTDILTALAGVVPVGSMLVLAGRVAPPLPLARLRAAGDLLELRTDDLALSRREAHLLLRGAGADVDDEATSDLIARTEGWAAGLALAARDGSERSLLDYFESEQLSRLSPERLRFVRRTSMLETLSAPLCDAVLASAGSAVELDALERANAFLVPLDSGRTTYRYHHLFREVLRRELERHEPALVPVLHRRAANWLEEHGDVESALDHADASGDAERAARILEAIALPAYESGRLDAVEAWLERFAAHASLDAHPGVAAVGAWINAVRGRLDAAERWLAAAEPVETTVLHAAFSGVGSSQLDRALAQLPPDSRWLPTALVVHGAAALLDGDADEADARFAAAAAAAERAGATVTQAVATAERSLLASAGDDHDSAERLALEARDLLSSGAFDEYATTAIVGAAAAGALLRHGRWDDARAELARSERLIAFLDGSLPWLAAQTRLAIGRAYVTLRDRDGALGQLAELERIGVLAEEIADLRAQIADMPNAHGGHTSGLTRAELRLVPLLATHLSFREIGERLYVSRNTIKTQAISAYRKLGVSNRSAAVERAIELGLVDAGASQDPVARPIA